MNAWMALPLPVRLFVVALAGALAGLLANRWSQRLQRRWSAPALADERRADDRRTRLADWVPLWGWWQGSYQAREALHGSRRGRAQSPLRPWRPLLVELSTAVGFVLLYWWETVRLGLIVPPLNLAAAAPFAASMQIAALAHLGLMALMLAATLIDLDEKLIPDEITITGTVVALLLAVAAPSAALPSVNWLASGRPEIESLHLASPQTWPATLEGRPQAGSLALAIGCLGAGCVALLPRTWRGRRGWRTAVALCWTRMRRERFSHWVALGFGVGSVLIAAVWYAGATRWQSLLSALAGMAVTGGIVWLVRIIGAVTLRREAMGFGDVTLMGMIGAFLGWQAGLMVFFVAPFFGLALGIVQAVAARDAEIPYGPYLCLGTLAVIVRWPLLWEATREVFGVGWLLPVTLAVLFLLMALLLGAWGRLRRRWSDG